LAYILPRLLGGDGKYLGLPETIGRKKRALLKHIRDRIFGRGGKNNCFIKQGKQLLTADML